MKRPYYNVYERHMIIIHDRGVKTYYAAWRKLKLAWLQLIREICKAVRT